MDTVYVRFARYPGTLKSKFLKKIFPIYCQGNAPVYTN